MRRSAAPKVTLEVQETCSRWTIWTVRFEGFDIGSLTKHKDTRTDTHPYRAHGLNDMTDPFLKRPFVGNFYKADGGKKAALAAIFKAYAEASAATGSEI